MPVCIAAFNYVYLGGQVLRLQESLDLGVALLKETLIPGLIISYLFYNEKTLTGFLGFGFRFLCSLGHIKFLLRKWCVLSFHSPPRPQFINLIFCYSPVCTSVSRLRPVLPGSFGMPCTVCQAYTPLYVLFPLFRASREYLPLHQGHTLMPYKWVDWSIVLLILSSSGTSLTNELIIYCFIDGLISETL